MPMTKRIAEMEIGQSILVDTHKDRCHALNFGRLNGITLSTRKENGAGYRIWKTSDEPAKRKSGKPRSERRVYVLNP